MNKLERGLGKIPSIGNMILNSFGIFIYSIAKGSCRKHLKKNIKFKNIHKGERCFIIGNGPSLKEQNLKLLENEYVFTVNQIMRNPDFKYLKTNYHFWTDPNFFNIDESKPEDLELLNVMKSLNTEDNEPECFIPVQFMDSVKAHGIDKAMKVNYYSNKLTFHKNFKSDFDFTKFVPDYGTVVQEAITMAIYMGFSEIYLLGCDSTSMVTVIKSTLKQNDENDYAYHISENEKIRMEKNLVDNDIEEYARNYWVMLRGYRFLRDFCYKKNIKIYNCSKTTIISSIPRKQYEEVVK